MSLPTARTLWVDRAVDCALQTLGVIGQGLAFDRIFRGGLVFTSRPYYEPNPHLDRRATAAFVRGGVESGSGSRVTFTTRSGSKSWVGKSSDSTTRSR